MSSPLVRDVTEANFEADVLVASDAVPVILDFWSPSCRPCLMLAPVLERLVHERNGQVLLAKVNTDDAPELAGYFQISAIPAIRVVANRQLVHQFDGLLPEPALRQFLDEICPPPDEELAAARAREQAAPAEAEALYRQKLAREPGNDDARLGLARVLLAQNKTNEIADVLEPIGPSGAAGAEAEALLARARLHGTAGGDLDALRRRVAEAPKDAAARLKLGQLLAGQGQYEPALAALLEAGELDAKLAAGAVRETMVQVFGALGSSHPLSNDYRSRLARLLY